MLRKINPNATPAIDVPALLTEKNEIQKLANPQLKELTQIDVAKENGCDKQIFGPWKISLPKSIGTFFSLAQYFGINPIDLIIDSETGKPYYERMQLFRAEGKNIESKFVWAFNIDEARQALNKVWQEEFEIIPFEPTEATILNE